MSKVSHVSVSPPSIPALLILPTFLTSLAVFVSPVVQHCFMGVAPETLKVICLCPHGCVCEDCRHSQLFSGASADVCLRMERKADRDDTSEGGKHA